MDQNSVRSALAISGFTSASLALSWNPAGTVVTITPSGGLLYNAGSDLGSTTARTYTVTIGTTAADLAGNDLQDTFTSSFSTLREISQSIAATTVAHYFDYGVSQDGTVQICATTSETYQIGYDVGLTVSGDTYGIAELDLTLPTNVMGIPSAAISVQQSTPVANFYTSGVVVLNELAYNPITASNMTWILGAQVANAFGTLSSTYATTSSLDITSVFASEIASGQRNFLYQFASKNGANNAYAVYYCGQTLLALKYLTP